MESTHEPKRIRLMLVFGKKLFHRDCEWLLLLETWLYVSVLNKKMDIDTVCEEIILTWLYVNEKLYTRISLIGSSMYFSGILLRESSWSWKNMFRAWFIFLKSDQVPKNIGLLWCVEEIILTWLWMSVSEKSLTRSSLHGSCMLQWNIFLILYTQNYGPQDFCFSQYI